MHNILAGYTQLSGPLYHYIPGRLSRYPLSIDSKVMKPKAELWTCLVTLGKWVGWLKALGLPHEDINQQLLVYYPSSCNSLFTSQKLNPQLGDLFFPPARRGVPRGREQSFTAWDCGSRSWRDSSDRSLRALLGSQLGESWPSHFGCAICMKVCKWLIYVDKPWVSISGVYDGLCFYVAIPS